MISKELLGELVKAPLVLLGLKDQQSIDYVNNLLPYSVGFEIECDMANGHTADTFKAIPDIMAVSNDSSEQRYRIPNGIRGMICLYNICSHLKTDSLLNPLSGIHYHIDCSEGVYEELSDDKFIKKNADWILKELDTWGYKGTFNSRRIDTGFSWIRLQSSFETFEFRIGEMTFDYDLILKRMMHCCSIMKRLKDMVGAPPPVFIEPDKAKIVAYHKDQLLNNSKYYLKMNNLQSQLDKLKEEVAASKKSVDLSDLPPIRKRIHRIKSND